MPFIVNVPTVAPSPPVARYVGVFSGAKASIRNRRQQSQQPIILAPTTLAPKPPAPPLGQPRVIQASAAHAHEYRRPRRQQPIVNVGMAGAPANGQPRYVHVFTGARASIRNRQQPRQPLILSNKVPTALARARFVSVQAAEASLRNRQTPRQPLHFPAGGPAIPIARSVIVLASRATNYYQRQPHQPIINVGSTAAAPGQQYVRQLATQASLRNRQQPRPPIIGVGKTKVTVPLPPAVLIFRGAIAASRLARHEPHQPIVLRGSTAQPPAPKSIVILAAEASLRNRQQPHQPIVNIGPDNTLVQACPYYPARVDGGSPYRPVRVDPFEHYRPMRVPEDSSYVPARPPGCGG
jgi:hypothetical protein